MRTLLGALVKGFQLERLYRGRGERNVMGSRTKRKNGSFGISGKKREIIAKSL